MFYPNFPHRSRLHLNFSERGYGDEDAGLSIDIVAFQLRSFPKLLHWFLHKVFRENLEIYVSFPNMAVPPRVIIDLHRYRLELLINFTDTTVDKHKNLSNVTLYETINHDSILMKFLKQVLPHGRINPNDIRKILKDFRRDG